MSNLAIFLFLFLFLLFLKKIISGRFLVLDSGSFVI